MTTTDTTQLRGLLSARKAETVGVTAQADEIIPPADPRTGEIMPAAMDTAPSPSAGQGDSASSGPSVAPAPVEAPIPFPPIPPKVIGGLPYATQYVKLAHTIKNTEMVPGALRGRYDAITACFMRGYEMGMGPMQSLDSFTVIDGKVGLTAEAMRALIINAGHQILLEDVRVDAELLAVVARCHRSEWPAEMWMEFEFGLAEAGQAGLLGATRSGKPSTWDKYPRAMMDARATSGAGRRYFPDVLAGMSYTPEELREFDGPIEEAPSPSDVKTAAVMATAEAGADNETIVRVAQATSPPDPMSPPPGWRPNPSPSPAPAPVASSVDEPPCLTDADSTPTASATSEGTPDSAPATRSSSPRKARGSTKKAAPKSTPAPSSDAPSAPPPEASTLLPAQDPPTGPSQDQASPVTNTGPSNGEGPVLAQMRSALSAVVNGQPDVQRPLIRAFLLQHFPQGATGIHDIDDLQKCIDIAAGWPGTIETYPAPELEPEF